jgi:hypothetical protein
VFKDQSVGFAGTLEAADELIASACEHAPLPMSVFQYVNGDLTVVVPGRAPTGSQAPN